MYSFENNLQRLSRWLERMEVRLSTELPESKLGEQEKTTLERVEAFYEEALKERSDFRMNEFLCRYEVKLLNNETDAVIKF